MKRTLVLAARCAWLALLPLDGIAQDGSANPPGLGHISFQADFEGSNALTGWAGTAQLAPGHDSLRSLLVENSVEKSSAVISRRLPVDQLRGCTLRISGSVRAESVSPKPNSWNGIKVMLVVQGAAATDYPQAPLETGSFDWRPAAFTARIPQDTTNLTLVLGLEQVTGKAWFDDIKVVTTKIPKNIARPAPVPGPMYKGHTLARLRGTMISPSIDAAGLRVLGKEWNANLLRWQLIRSGRPSQAAGLDDYDVWLEGELKRLDAALPLCEQNGLMVVVDLHSPPGGKGTIGGYVGSDHGLFTNPKAQEKFVELWSKIAARYKASKVIWGYDLANEPVEEDVEEGCADWPALAERAARAIRSVDPHRTIIVEPANWGSPYGLRDFVPLPISNVVYSVHMYEPHQFTHQGVHQKSAPLSYPGVINGRSWDKAALESVLQPAIDFQKRYNVHIYIGEFSAIRWAPDNSAHRYLSDLIDIFEAHGWDWTYHAFREWHGWSVEHNSNQQDTRPAASPTDRQRLLTDWFARNEKPGKSEAQNP